jgi:hypothetical protein
MEAVVMSRVATEQERAIARYTWLTATDAGKQLGGVGSAQVISWYDAGLLTGFDASREGAKKRDVRFRQEWVDAFAARRTSRANAA